MPAVVTTTPTIPPRRRRQTGPATEWPARLTDVTALGIGGLVLVRTSGYQSGAVVGAVLLSGVLAGLMVLGPPRPPLGLAGPILQTAATIRASVVAGATAGVVGLVMGGAVSPVGLVAAVLLSALLQRCGRGLLRRAGLSGADPVRLVVAGTGPDAERLCDLIAQQPIGLDVVSIVEPAAVPDAVRTSGAEVVALSEDLSDPEVDAVVRAAAVCGVRILDARASGRLPAPRQARPDDRVVVPGLPLMVLEGSVGTTRLVAAARRMADLVLGGVVWTVLTPVAALSAAVLRTVGSRPSLQPRPVVGRHGRRVIRWVAQPADRRRLVRVLHLWHDLRLVVLGRLSLIGPQPLAEGDPPPADAAPADVRPGLTGLWRLAPADLRHGWPVRGPVSLDLAILLHTVLRRPGASPAPDEVQPAPDDRVPTAGLTVLHVAESLAAGVATALESYVTLTPELNHTVLGWRRPESQIGDGLADHCTVVELPPGRLAQRRAVAEAIRTLEPDVVHAHSSWAGVYVRTVRGVNTDSVVFSPHCYAFERHDVRLPVRAAFRLIERVLSHRTRVVAAVSDHEARLAAALNPRVPAVLVPHVPDLPTAYGTRATASALGRPLTVAALGRVSAQKGISFLIEATTQVGPEVRWRWIGGGEPTEEARLRAAGVDVIGWVPRPQALAELADADVYVHTAGWEGMPLTVLEAAAYGLPVVARRIGPLDRIGLPRLADTPAALAAHVEALLDPAVRSETALKTAELCREYTEEEQRHALLGAYARCGSASPVVTTDGTG